MTLKTTQLRDAIRYAIVVGATAVVGTGAAYAQDASSDQEEATTLDAVQVTGSRLKRAEIEGALPVTVISRDEIQASGQTTVSDYLRTSNFNSAGQFRPQSGSSAQAGAFADLRGLGSQRTLVLIDGHRLPKAPFAAGAGSDLNAIPLAAVERIEVLSDGASAIYGADAIGGVINIITRKDYNGAQVSVEKAIPKFGPTDAGSIVFGTSGDRGSVIGGFSYSRRAMIYTNQRPWGQALGVSTYGNNYRAFDPVTGDPLTGILALPNGCNDPNFWTQSNGRCSFNFNAVAAEEAQYGNKAMFLNAEVNINDNWSLYTYTNFVNTSTFGRYAPTPGVVTISPDSPANPYPGAETDLYHRFAAAGNRDNSTDSDVYDILVGTRGTIGENVDVDAGLRYNRYDYSEFGRNYIVGSLAEQAINRGDYNIYNPTATPEDVLNSIKATITRESTWTTKEAFATFTFNDLFQLGGGGSGLAVGGEFRRETYADVYDSLSAAGVILGSSGASSGGAREVTSLYAEWLLPFTSTFEMNLAGRYERYSDFGNAFSPKLSMRWHPVDSFTLRASVGKGFVAPTLDIITQETAFSADFVLDPATCIDQGAGNPQDCADLDPSTELQIDAYRERAAGLGPEESLQWQLGVVWDATDWLNMSLDYWNINIKDRIAYFGSQKLVEIDLGIDPTPMPGAPCSLVRDPSRANALGNPISEIHNCYFNQGEVETDGLDFTARTNFDLGASGELRNVLRASYLNKQSIDGGDNLVGVQGLPAIRATLQNAWERGDWAAGLDVLYTGPNGRTSSGNYTSHYTTYNVHGSVNTPWNGKFTIGVNNFTNKMPEEVGYDGRTYNMYLYDAYGRMPYFRYEQNF